MYLTNLAAIARGAGLRVVEQPGWQSRGHGPMSGVKTIVAHHTAGPATGNAPSLSIVQNGRSDLAGPLAHFVLGRDGTVYVVAAGQCWHTGATWQTAQSNAYAIGIEAEATGTASWPEVQMDAYARLCRALCAAFGLGVDRVQGHKEVCSPAGRKTDPNFDMSALRARVAKAAGGGGAPTADTGGAAAPTTGVELMERITVTPPNKDQNAVRVFLSGSPGAAVIIRPRLGGDGFSKPMWVGDIFAWGSDHQGIGHNPTQTPGYNNKLTSHRRYDLPGAVWADINYSAADPFDIDIVG